MDGNWELKTFSQWRLDTLSSYQKETLIFPISFTSIVCAIVSENSFASNVGSIGWSCSSVMEFSLEQAGIYYTDSKGFLLVIGY